MKLCTVSGCGRSAKARKLCIRHYHRWSRHGDPEAGGSLRILNVRERWLSCVDKTPDCWLWTGQLNNKGYGLFSINGGKRAAHRVGYEMWVGAIPAHLVLDHLCLVKRCVNPAHLEPVTVAENQRRMGATKTQCKYGHAYTEENTYRSPRGERRCRECSRERDRRRVATRSEAQILPKAAS